MLELLAAVCLVRGGHEIILSAFDNFKEVGYSIVLKECSHGIVYLDILEQNDLPFMCVCYLLLLRYNL